MLCFRKLNHNLALLESLLLQRLFFLLQALTGGAGIYVEHGGEATLTNSSVYENEAKGYVLLLHSNLPRQFLQ